MTVPTYVYAFEDGDGRNKLLLGGKGANLCVMTQLGLAVPPGFVITTEACLAYLADGRPPPGMLEQVRAHITALEAKTGKRFGDPSRPLLVSVRSGSAMSMPGMMDTILNLGLNDDTAAALARLTDNPRFAYDAWRRFIQLFGKIAMGLPDEPFDHALAALRRRVGAAQDVDLSADDLRGLCAEYAAIYQAGVGAAIPTDPYAQLELAIEIGRAHV